MPALKDQIVRAAFNGVEFPVLSFNDRRANAVAEHKSWRQDGSRLEDTGREALTVTMRVGLLNGMTGAWPADLFPGLYDRLLTEFLDAGRRLGTLTHPYLGPFPALFKDLDASYDPACQQGIHLDLTFLEDNGAAVSVTGDNEQEPGAALERSAEAADALVAPLAPAAKPVKPVVDTQLAYLEASDRVSAEAFGAVAEILAAAEASLALPALMTEAGYPARAALREVERAAWAYRARYLSPKPEARTFTTQAPMSLASVAAHVYGDAGLAWKLRAANTVPNELRVPAGTVFKVPDDE